MNYSNEDYEDERARKQKYLKTHILNDPNYDPDEFVNYMEQAKPEVDGKEIDNWDFDELVEKVQEFKAEKEKFEGEAVSSRLYPNHLFSPKLEPNLHFPPVQIKLFVLVTQRAGQRSPAVAQRLRDAEHLQPAQKGPREIRAAALERQGGTALVPGGGREEQQGQKFQKADSEGQRQ